MVTTNPVMRGARLKWSTTVRLLSPQILRPLLCSGECKISSITNIRAYILSSIVVFFSTSLYFLTSALILKTWRCQSVWNSLTGAALKSTMKIYSAKWPSGKLSHFYASHNWSPRIFFICVICHMCEMLTALLIRNFQDDHRDVVKKVQEGDHRVPEEEAQIIGVAAPQ